MIIQPTVLFVSLPPSLGGSVRALEGHLEALQGVRRVLAAPLDTQAGKYLLATGDFDEAVDVAVHRGSRIPASAAAAWSLRDFVGRHPVDAIHANGMPEMAVAWPAARRLGVPLVVWAHGVDVPRYVRAFAPVWKRGWVDLRWAAVSAAAADHILSSGVARPAQMAVVPNPIDPNVALADRADIDGGWVSLAFLGGDSVRKGYDLLAGLMHDLQDLPVRLFTAGTSPKEDDPNWQALATHGERVVPLGGLSDVREIYGRADIVLMPSRQESFGRVAAEAMLNGLPVVAFDIPALREVVGDGEGGLLVPLDDAAALSKAVRTLVEQPDLRAALAGRGRIRAEQYLPAKVSMQLRALYGI